MKQINPPLIFLPETASTNTYLRELLNREGVAEGTTVYTDKQTAGRGQKGNTWESEVNKNLAFSMVLYPHFIPVTDQFIISQCVALGTRDTLKKYVADIKIKWPNDIYWKQQKICGILIENSLDGNGIRDSIIGIGVNINQETFSCQTTISPTSLKLITGKSQDRMEILQQIISRILEYYAMVKNGNSEQIATEYKKDLFCTGTFKDSSGVFNAAIHDVLPSGLLVLQDDNGTTRRYAFKEVEYIIP